MRPKLPNAVHPFGCSCMRCAPRALRKRRIDVAMKGATRVLLLIAVIIAIPFIIAWTLANASGDRR